MSEIKREGYKIIIKPDNDIVASIASTLRMELNSLVQESPKELEIDLSNVKMVDSVGIGVIIATHNSLSKIDGKLNVTKIANDIYSLFTTMRLDRHFSVEAAN